MSKYSIAKELIEAGAARAKESGIDEQEILEALLVLSIQNLVAISDGKNTRQFVEYQLDSMASGAVQEVQRPGFG